MEHLRWGHFPVTVSPVQPYAATKRYVCPGCEAAVEPGTFHLVVVPDEMPDLRRHWHRGCWHRQQRAQHGKTPGENEPRIETL